MKKLLFASALGGGILAAMIGVNWMSLSSTPTVEARPQLASGSLQSPIHRCMNMGGALEAPREGDWGYTIRRSDLKRLKSAGFDTIRVPIKFSAHSAKSPPFQINPSFLKRVDEIVDWALLEGLQIIIDVHHYDELMQAPNIHERRLEKIWDQLAYHYQNAPDQLMFELINEPHSNMTVERTDALNARLVSRIRRDNPNRWIVVGSAGWGSLDALAESRPPRSHRLIGTFHYYDPFEVTHQGATWMEPSYPLGARWRGTASEKAQIKADFDIVKRWQAQTGMPVLLGEFGVYEKADLQSRADWAGAVRRESEAQGFGWCFWEWGTGFNVYDVSRERWISPIRDALVSP